jgi:RNA polymerase sigma-70 factor (ECF subfamily)
MAMNVSARTVRADGTLGSLMVAAQAGDRLAYRQLLSTVAMRAREACTQNVRTRELGPAGVQAIVDSVLLGVHAARATFDPAHSFDVWLAAMISAQLAQSARRHRAVAREPGGGLGALLRALFAR